MLQEAIAYRHQFMSRVGETVKRKTVFTVEQGCNTAFYCNECGGDIKEADTEGSLNTSKTPINNAAAELVTSCNRCGIVLKDQLTTRGIFLILRALANYVEGLPSDDDEHDETTFDIWAYALKKPYNYPTLRDHSKFILAAFERVRALEAGQLVTKQPEKHHET